jgi:indolepyruvate ferredoxin oxidoreductase
MNTPLAAAPAAALRAVSLDDKYTRARGRIFITGNQALARLPMLQKERDLAAGLNTAGYISGYRGSPLAGFDLALGKAKSHLAAHDIVFQPGVNEELAADAVWGTQQLNLYASAQRDGVFGLWYGKGPGLDRSADALKHANAAGTSRHGGVLLLAGDDHGAKSSTLAHQSEHLLSACGIPVLYPSSIQEYLDYGLHGWAMSRYSGLWVAMKCVTDIVETSGTVDVDPDRLQLVIPTDFVMPEGGLNIRWPDPPLAQEARMLSYKWYAALAYVRANRLNRVVFDSPQARFGIMAGGKSYLDMRQALIDLGLDDDACRRVGIRIYKVGCVWPLEALGAREFATGLSEILVVEEKRQFLEYTLKEELYNWRSDVRPRIYGKFDERDDGGGEWSVPRGQALLPMPFEHSPAMIAKVIAARLLRLGVPDDVRAHITARLAVVESKEREAEKLHVTAERKPWYCSGCPHNSSTKVPEGSRALAGIGCHYLVLGMDRNTTTFTQMGGEGVPWLGQMHFCSDRHVFVNLGDGTYFHSGLLAIRAAIAAHANITYKILFNDAVAMTGGQPVDGTLTVQQIAHQVLAEGATRVVVVSDEPEKYAARTGLPDSVTVHHRSELDSVQRTLREISGTSVLIYDQVCATEKRRRRKRGRMAESPRRAFINEAVCEGCGDCSRTSNCLSVEPVETELGTKRRINQSSCNQDLSCVDGFCPSFVTTEGAQLHQPAAARLTAPGFDPQAIAEPPLPALAAPCRILVTGVGGTGVVTIGALLGMAAHLDGAAVTVLDVTGLAQKGGAVLSHVQLARSADQIYSTRIATAAAQVMIGCDEIVASSSEALLLMQSAASHAVINTARTPTAEFVLNRNWEFPAASAEQAVLAAVGQCEFLNASATATELLGDAIYANPLLVGYAWQKGWLPLTRAALLRAIELNEVSIEKNRLAFECGRYLAVHGTNSLTTPTAPATEATLPTAAQRLAALIEHRTALLTSYQNAAYATRYQTAVQSMRGAELAVVGGTASATKALLLTEAVARNLAKLMAYKDEYEVARLYSGKTFLEQLRAQFAGEPGKDYRLQFHLAPPLLAKLDTHGHLIKRAYGAWMLPAFRMLAKLKGLRGTAFDIFGKTAERRMERRLVVDYLALVDELCASLKPGKHAAALELARLPEQIRGYGHVKDQSMAIAATRRAELLTLYRAAPSNA